MTDYDTARPYLSSYLIARKENKIAFVLRTNTGWMNGYYGLPSGKVEKQESFTEAAIREGFEEIGIRLSNDNLKVCFILHRITNGDNGSWPDAVDAFFEVDGYDGEVYNAEPDVHGELAWLDPHNLPENILPYIKYVLEQIEAGESYAEYRLSA